MQTVTLVGLAVVMAITLFNSPRPAAGVCCTQPQQVVSSWFTSVKAGPAGAGIRENRCNDCTRPTPYCGRGKCNFFGCNCAGGCRTGRCERRRRSVNGLISDYANASAIVASGDIDGDGALSLDEAQQMLPRSEVVAKLRVQRALRDLDINGDGKLTPLEIDPTDF